MWLHSSLVVTRKCRRSQLPATLLKIVKLRTSAVIKLQIKCKKTEVCTKVNGNMMHLSPFVGQDAADFEQTVAWRRRTWSSCGVSHHRNKFYQTLGSVRLLLPECFVSGKNSAAAQVSKLKRRLCHIWSQCAVKTPNADAYSKLKHCICFFLCVYMCICVCVWHRGGVV